MEILHVCPANCATGGTEAIHEFVCELNKIEGVHARIWFRDIKSDPPMPEEFAAYNCDYVTELPAGYSGIIIYPEIWANRALDFPHTAIYWLGVDAYAGWTLEAERGDFLRRDDIVHIAQSDYAKDFLQKLGVKRIVKCTDMLNPEFYEPYQEEERGDTILYNPAKATPFLRELIEKTGFKFRPIQGMTRAEVINTMRHSKLYIDFGEFPGRERIPREAALCGCCIITSKIGAAAYDGDFCHSYKFDSKPAHIWAIKRKIQEVLEHYDKCRKDFARLRMQLILDREKIPAQVADVVRALKDEV